MGGGSARGRLAPSMFRINSLPDIHSARAPVLTSVPASLCLGFLELDHDMKILHRLPSRDEESRSNGMNPYHKLFVRWSMYDAGGFQVI